MTHCKDLETHGQERHHGSVFHQVPVLEATPVVTQEPGKLDFVFSSGLTDVALRLGPDRNVSGEKQLYKDSIGPCTRQIKTKQKHNRPQTKTTRKSPSQICVSSQKGTWQTGSSGQSGNSAATFGMPPVF